MNQPGSVRIEEGDSVPLRNHKMIRNMANIEIGELKDALSYAEYLLAKNMKEKEELMGKQAEH